MTATVTRVSHDMSAGWMRDNPELVGKALTEFVTEHPPEEWTLTIRRAHMPGMSVSLVAVRK